MTQIQIKYTGSSRCSLESLSILQDNLKDLSKENYEKLKKNILTYGFSEPITTWFSEEDQKHYIISGTQRFRTLQKMKEEGYEIPYVIVNSIFCSSKYEAHRVLLSLASQYGEVTEQGLYEFMNQSYMSIEELRLNFRFPEINFNDFQANFFEEPKAPKTKPGDIWAIGPHRLVCGHEALEESDKLISYYEKKFKVKASLLPESPSHSNS